MEQHQNQSACRAVVRGQPIAWYLLLVCTVGVVLATPGLGRSPAKAGQNVLRDWYQLSAAEALKGLAVELDGIVVCYDLGWGQFYVHDGAKAIYLNPRGFTGKFEVGQHVKITGTTTWDGTVPVLTNATARITGTGPLPQATSLSLQKLATHYGQWVETVGQIRVVEASRERLTLILKDGAQECLVYVMQTSSATRFKYLADCRVRVWGINASRITAGHLESAILFSPGIPQIQVIAPSPNDRWHLPVTAIEALLAKPVGDWTNQPVHVNGLVTEYQPGRALSLKDPTGLIDAEVIQVTPVTTFQRLDVWGFLALKTNRPALTDAYFEVSSGETKSEHATGIVAEPAEVNEPPLTEIKQIRALSKARANQHLPVLVRGVLTFADPSWRVLFLQSGPDAIFLDTDQSDLQTGQLVEVMGQTEWSGFAPQVVHCVTKVLEATALPTPARIDLQDAAGGQLDSRWVELEAVVRRVTKDNGRLTVSLASSSGRFTATVLDDNPKPVPSAWIDSVVSIRGAAGSTLNSRGQISGVHLHVPGRQEVKIIDPSPADPFAIPATPLAEVATFQSAPHAGRRIKVRGVVTLAGAGQMLYLQDPSGAMRIRGVEAGEVQTGEQVEVVGFPGLLDFSPTIEEAALRRFGAVPCPPPKKRTAMQLLQSGKDDGLLVELDADVLQRFSKGVQSRLTLQDGPIVFSAEVVRGGAPGSMAEFEPGSRILVRGVCSISSSENHEPSSFRLLIPSAQDIVLLSAAPWWTARHTMAAVSGALLSILLAGAWVLSLRRQVRAQTKVIQRNQQELVETSRLAGMAEVATSVLHNVGNVLNSVNTSAALVVDLTRNSCQAGVGKVAHMLESNRQDLASFVSRDGCGDRVIEYLKALARQSESERARVLAELQGLAANIEHIKEIVAMQQNYAKVGGLVEMHSVQALVEDALRLHEAALARHDVRVTKELTQVPQIALDKHKVLQILVNLISNAKHALSSSAAPERRLVLAVDRPSDQIVRVSVRDNGVGIAAENITRIFSHGFTTRSEGHGFGLHSGALAAREMGGSLSAHSDGLGAGATFTLELPTQTPNPLPQNERLSNQSPHSGGG